MAGVRRRLEAATGLSVDLRREGTLVLALNADDHGRLRHQLEFQKRLALPLDWITPAEARRREPHLGAIAGAVFSPEDHQIDNRRLAAALKIAAAGAGAIIREHTDVVRISTTGARASGVELADGTEVAASTVVIAAGAWSRAIDGVPQALRPPVRPVKGQMLALRGCGGTAHQPRGVGAEHLHGAAQRRAPPPGRDRRGERLRHDADRRRRARAAGSRLAGAAGDRGPADRRDVGRPSAGQPRRRADPRAGGARRVVNATGHHRNGILLTPVTANAIARLVADGAIDAAIRPFGLERFALPQAAE